MKKTLLLIAVALFVSSTAFSQFKFGVGGALGTKASATGELGFGAQARATYELADEMNLEGGFTYFFRKDAGFWILNADFQYEFATKEDFTFYGLGGVNYNKLKGMDGKIGFEAGAGLTFSKFFAEAKYNFKLEQFEAGVGIYF
jgi:hypothetical protein